MCNPEISIKNIFSTLVLLFTIYSINFSFANSNDKVALLNIVNMEVGVPWTKITQNEVFNIKGHEKIDSMIDSAFNNTPISILDIGHEKIFSDFSKKAKIIADFCKNKNIDRWKQISCISHSIRRTLLTYRWSDYSSSCRAHAEAFRQTFKELKIPHSTVTKIHLHTDKGFDHIFNKLIITSSDGQYFSYIVDLFYGTGVAYPFSISAKKHHDKNNDGITDNKNFPEINLTPSFSFRPDCHHLKTGPINKLGDFLSQILFPF